MKMKTVVGFLTCLFIALILLAPPVYAETPKYDATGTWDYQISNSWTDCATPPDISGSGSSVIKQTGSTFSFNSGGRINYGTVAGSRYQFFDSGSDSLGNWTFTELWTLTSPNFGSGYITQTYVGGCSFSVDMYVEKRTPFNCTPSDTTMCLRNGRYSVSVTWRNQDEETGMGHAVPFTDDSGLFWFFNDTNMELLIKVLDGCGINSRYWVFFAATTDQEFTVTVTDTKTGEFQEYTNPLGTPADAVTDTSAFATCP